MADTLLCSGNIPLAFSFPGGTPSSYRYSSTASTAVCYEQVFTETPDPRPATEDWFNFITGFNAGDYSAFGMTAFVTSVMSRFPHSVSPGSDLPSKMQFRTVISTAGGSGSGDSAYIPVDGIANTEWTTYSSNNTTVAPGVVEVEHFEFSASASSASSLTLYDKYDLSSIGSTSTPSGGRPGWTGVPGAVSASASSLYKSKFSKASTSELMVDFNFYVNTAQRATVVESGFYGNSYDYFSGISAKASATGTATANVLNWMSSQFFSTESASATSSGYSGYVATATIAVPSINGGSAYAQGRLTYDGRNLLNTSWIETEDLPTLTVLASASASGMLSSICGEYPGYVSASVGGYDDTYLMNPSGIAPGYDSTHTGEDEYYWRMRSAWSAGYLTSTPVGCGLSGILELYPKGGTGSAYPILSSATGG